MNTGIISTRYATALLKFVEETGGGERVSAQVWELLHNKDARPEVLEPELERLVRLLLKNGRMGDIRFILRTFISMYYRSKGMRLVRLISTDPVSEDIQDRLCKLLEKQFACKVSFDMEVDSSLIGGFVLIIDDYMLDASVKHQIELIRREFIVQNNRLV